jgi:schlafen family protein
MDYTELESGFDSGTPVSHPDFLYGDRGPSQLLRRLERAATTGTHVQLLGERRSGKTSHLKCLAYRLGLTDNGERGPLVPVLLNVIDYPEISSADDAFRLLIAVTHEAVTRTQPTRTRLFPGDRVGVRSVSLDVTWDRDAALRTLASANHEAGHALFRSYFEAIERVGIGIVLLLDEYENIVNAFGHNHAALFTLREVALRPRPAVGRRALTVMLAGSESWDRFAQRVGSPVFNFVSHTEFVSPLDTAGFGTMWMSCLSRSRVDEAVRRNWPPPQTVHELAGGWPFYGKVIGDQLVRNQPEARVDQAQVFESLRPHFQVIWNRLSPSEQDALTGRRRPTTGQARELQQLGLLDGDTLRPRGTLFSRFIADQSITSTEVQPSSSVDATGTTTERMETAMLVERPESHVLERKSTARVNLHTGDVDPRMQAEVVEAICAFLNTDGGTLLIGVADDGRVLGLDVDIRTVKRRDIDGLENWLAGHLLQCLGPSVVPYYKTRFDSVDDVAICRIDVRPSREPVFVRGKGNEGKRMFIRVQNTTRELDIADAISYIRNHHNFADVVDRRYKVDRPVPEHT